MSFKEFNSKEIEDAKEQYAAEVKERWGNTDAYKESAVKTSGYTKEKWNHVHEGGELILKNFANCRHLSPDSKEAMELVRSWKEYITSNFYTCTNEILAGLKEMYVADERFMKNINKHGEGTAKFMSEAINYFLKKEAQ